MINASSSESMNRTAATSVVDEINAVCTSSSIEAPSPRGSMNTASGSGSVSSCSANHRMIPSYTAPARPSDAVVDPVAHAETIGIVAAIATTTAPRQRADTSTLPTVPPINQRRDGTPARESHREDPLGRGRPTDRSINVHDSATHGIHWAT